MIDRSVLEAPLVRALSRARERDVVIPTFAEMRDPWLIPAPTVDRLSGVGISELDPVNLFRIGWHNEPIPFGGGFGPVNYLEYPPELTGVDARIVTLIGKWFPTGTHKVGAAFGCLVPRLVTGRYDPTSQVAAWPSTGNYCRGGAYDSALLGCESLAILPEGMSRERFEWLESVAGEVVTTPGSESNVKEIFDKCRELTESGRDIVIFNQFDEFGNYLWHYGVTGPAMAEVIERVELEGDAVQAVVLTTGSAGTLASGDYLKQRFPDCQIVAGEALQCPTLMKNGHGSHRIEGVGDKHVPWIHNVANTDAVVGIDDEDALQLVRLFNEPAGATYLASVGVPSDVVRRLPELGISSIANLIGSIKYARLHGLGKSDIIMTVATDSIEMYQSRVTELRSQQGRYTLEQAAQDLDRRLHGQMDDNLMELGADERERIHNLKYFTWVEQQGKDVEELDAQWNDPDYWTNIQSDIGPLDALIQNFNRRVMEDR